MDENNPDSGPSSRANRDIDHSIPTNDEYLVLGAMSALISPFPLAVALTVSGIGCPLPFGGIAFGFQGVPDALWGMFFLCVFTGGFFVLPALGAISAKLVANLEFGRMYGRYGAIAASGFIVLVLLLVFRIAAHILTPRGF